RQRDGTRSGALVRADTPVAAPVWLLVSRGPLHRPVTDRSVAQHHLVVAERAVGSVRRATIRAARVRTDAAGARNNAAGARTGARARSSAARARSSPARARSSAARAAAAGGLPARRARASVTRTAFSTSPLRGGPAVS